MFMSSLISQVTINSRHFEAVAVIIFAVTRSFGKNVNRDGQKSSTLHLYDIPLATVNRDLIKLTLNLRNYSLKIKLKKKML